MLEKLSDNFSIQALREWVDCRYLVLMCYYVKRKVEFKTTNPLWKASGCCLPLLFSLFFIRWTGHTWSLSEMLKFILLMSWQFSVLQFICMVPCVSGITLGGVVVVVVVVSFAWWLHFYRFCSKSEWFIHFEFWNGAWFAFACSQGLRVLMLHG